MLLFHLLLFKDVIPHEIQADLSKKMGGVGVSVGVEVGVMIRVGFGFGFRIGVGVGGLVLALR